MKESTAGCKWVRMELSNLKIQEDLLLIPTYLNIEYRLGFLLTWENCKRLNEHTEVSSSES